MNIKRLFSNWQGFTALLAALAVFWFSPHLLHWLDPTAGTFDVGYLQRPLVAAAYFFFATFCAWTAFQIEFPTLNHRCAITRGVREPECRALLQTFFAQQREKTKPAGQPKDPDQNS